MKRILKYGIYDYDSVVKLELPRHAEVLTAQMQGPDLMAWFLVDDDIDMEERYFLVRGTGQKISDNLRLKYIATTQDGPLVWHLFEVL